VSTNRQRFYLAYALIHFALIGAVCVHETLWLLKEGVVVVAATPQSVWKKLDRIPAWVTGDESGSRNPWQKAIASYTNAAGIEAGYGYFAPNIPPTYALVFECSYPDGRIDYQTPELQGEAAQLRVTTLIEQIGRTDYDRWRMGLIRLLARSTWRIHPDAISMRAFFGTVTPPTLAEYRAGRTERIFNCLYVYDFRREVSKDGQSIQ
jgi:hypothetical protein